VQAIASKAVHFAAQSGVSFWLKIFLSALVRSARGVAERLHFRERTRNRASNFA